MYFISTRDKQIRQTLSQAIQYGLAEDGGLFVPEMFPKVNLDDFSPDLSYPEFAKKLLQLFFSEDKLDKNLSSICDDALVFPIPLKSINPNTFMLELFHGPTSSFKDVGARFLAGCISAFSTEHKTTILVATSGDTGSAVASAFYLKPNVDVVVLYPENLISKRQEHQITCWDKNILALAVKGTFDDCQKLVKAAFHDSAWQSFHLSSANSINIGRLLPQMTYYAYTSLQFYRMHHTMPGFIVPTGNLGNATAGYWAKMMGFPIREIALATNENKTIPDYLATGEYHPRLSIATLANAMDVGNPSNFERLKYLFNTFDAFKQNVQAISVSDEQIKQTIQAIFNQYQMIICPHTATAFYTRNKLSEQPWIVVATADASKFDEIVEPIVKTQVPVAPQLQAMLAKPAQVIKVKNELNEIKNKITNEWKR